MKRTLVLTLGLLTATAVSVEAQLLNFPVYATPSGEPATFLAAGYGRGLNDASGKQDAYGAAVGRTGIGNRVTVLGAAALIDSDPESEWTFAGAVGIDVLPTGGSAQVSVQSGIGYFSPSDNFSLLHFPIGVALKGMIEGPTANVEPWIMPRLSVVRTSNGTSNTETDFGVSGGFGVTLPSGFGIHTALDLLAVDPDNTWLLGVGVHYIIP